MKARQLLRTDLPKRRSTNNSLHIPVLLRGKKAFICDIHFSNNELCYLEKAKGVTTKISRLLLITDERTKEDVINEIEFKKIKKEKFDIQSKKLQKEIGKLKIELGKI